MSERQPSRVASDDIPQMDTPVIDMQDVEHQESDETRVNSQGVEVKPTKRASPVEAVLAEIEHDLEDEDRKIQEAIAEFEQEHPTAPPR
jgi:hypothetical protein